MTAQSIREAMARAMCFQDVRNHTWHCNPDALAEPAHWGRSESGNLDRRLTNWEVRAYLADAALAVALPILREHFAGVVERSVCGTHDSEKAEWQRIQRSHSAATIRADEGPR